ncbi:hypothetical protein AAG906_019597 [Vitis piasezkii]
MCGGDDHLAWKRPVSLEACRGLRITGGIPSLHVGASEGLQSLFGHSLDSLFPLLVSIEGSLVCFFERSDMDQRVVTVDQFTTAMTSIQEASAVSTEIKQMPRAPPYLLHGHSEVASPVVVQTTILEDTHACMDRIEQTSLRISIGVAWLMDLDGNRFSKPTNVDRLKRYYV